MLLGALVDAGVPLEVLPAASPRCRSSRSGWRPSRSPGTASAPPACTCTPRTSSHHRTWARRPRAARRRRRSTPAVRDGALAVFERLAVAEGRVHRDRPPDEVHFHEVGALDALADVVGVVAGFAHLGLDRLTASPVALGSGSARGAHGVVPIPGPAVLELLLGIPVVAGAGAGRDVHADRGRAGGRTWSTSGRRCRRCGSQRVGTGAGGRDPAELPNVVRLVLGVPGRARPGGPAVVLETNVDDLDPRLWPGVLDALFAAGRLRRLADADPDEEGPARRTRCRCSAGPSRCAAVQAAVFAATSTIGLRVAAGRQGRAGADAGVGRRARRPGGREARRRRRPGGQRERRVRGRRRARPGPRRCRSRRCCGPPPRPPRPPTPSRLRRTHSLSRRSASSGLTSSTRVMTAQRWPNGS